MTKTVSNSRSPDSITSNLVNGTAGALIYATGDGTTSTALTIGSNSQFLTVASSLPAWTSVLPSAQLDHNSIQIGSTIVALGGTTTTITGLSTPTNPTDAATKAYVDAHASGLTVESPAAEATSGSDLSALGPFTYNNGASGVGATITDTSAGTVFVVDGMAVGLNARVLIKDQTNKTQNGIYVLTTVGVAGTTPYQLTRATDFNSSSNITAGDFIFVTSGNTNAATSWVQTTTGTITVGTSNIVFTQFSSAAAYVGGTGINISGLTISNTGVTSLVAGSNISISSSTGAVTVNVVGSPAISGTNITNIPNGALVNSSVTIGSTPVALGGTATTIAGLSSVTSTSFVGALTGNASSASSATNIASGVAGNVPFQSAAGTTSFVTNAAGVLQALTSGATPAWTTSPTISGANFAATSIQNSALVNSSVTVNGTSIALGASGTVAAAAGTLTGTTLAANIVNSSLTSVGTLGTLTISGLTSNSFLFSGSGGHLTTTTAPTNGQLLIGSTGAAPVAGTLTAGTAISVVNGGGSITINNTGVTSIVAGTGISINSSTGAVTVTATGSVTNLAGGAANEIPYQSAPSTTAFVSPGTSGQVLVGTTGNPPSWSSTISGLTSISATTFNGTLSGNASSATIATAATNIAGGTAGNVAYQTAASTTAFVTNAVGVLCAATAGATPAWLTAPALTGTNFNGIPNSALSNSSVTIGSTAVSLGGTSTTIAGLTSVTSTSFVGALTGNASTSTSATNIAGGAAGSLPYQTGAGATTFLAVGSAGQVLTLSGGVPTWATPASSGLTATFIGYGSGSNSLTGTSDFTWTDSAQTLTMGTATTGASIVATAGSGVGPQFSITGSAGAAASGGGAVVITGGAGGASGAIGGLVTIMGGASSTNFNGGQVSLVGGTASAGLGGLAIVQGGNATASGALGGNVLITGGNATVGVGTAGSVTISTGNAALGGSIVFKVGTPPATAYTINTNAALGIGSTPSFGTSGQVLTSNGSGAAPSWTTAASTSVTATQIAYGSGSNTITSTPDFTWTESTTVPVLTLGTNSAATNATITAGLNTSTSVGTNLTISSAAGNSGATSNAAGGTLTLSSGAGQGSIAAVAGNGGVVNLSTGAGAAGLAQAASPFGGGVGGTLTIAGGTGGLGGQALNASVNSANGGR